MKPHALLLAATAAARPVVWFDGAEDVPKRVRRSRAVSVGVAYRSDDDAPAAVCLHDTCGGGDDACVDVVGPEATSRLNHGFGHCAPGAHALTVYAADGSSSATLEFDVAATPMVEAAVSQTSVTTNATARITVAVAADGRGALELCTMSPCGDWLRHLHNFHCRPVPAAGETAFDVTVGFDNCEPGQRSVSAILLPAGYLDAHPTTPIVDLWRVAGPGAYDEVVFTVAWDDASAANLNQLYFAPGDAVFACRHHVEDGVRAFKEPRNQRTVDGNELVDTVVDAKLQRAEYAPSKSHAHFSGTVALRVVGRRFLFADLLDVAALGLGQSERPPDYGACGRLAI